jgi:hypothetical protein
MRVVVFPSKRNARTPHSSFHLTIITPFLLLKSPASQRIDASVRLSRATVFLMPSTIIDLANPGLGAELLRDAKGELPIDVWRVYVMQHSGFFTPSLVINQHPPLVINWCVVPHTSTLDPSCSILSDFLKNYTPEKELSLLSPSNGPAIRKS